MLSNTRGRTVFNDTPKRLPADIDKLSLYKGTIVRKRSLNRLPFGGGLADDSPSARGSRDSTPKSSSSKGPVGEGLPVGDLSARPGRPPLGLRRSASTPMASPCGSARGLGGRPPPPPPLPSFPSNWKTAPSDLLKPMSGQSQCAGGPEDVKLDGSSNNAHASSSAVSDKLPGPALRPTPKPLRERAPDLLDSSLSSSIEETPLPSGVAIGSSRPSGYPHTTAATDFSCAPSVTGEQSPSTQQSPLASGVTTCNDHEIADVQTSSSSNCQAPSVVRVSLPEPSDANLHVCPGPGLAVTSSPYPSVDGNALPLAPVAMMLPSTVHQTTYSLPCTISTAPRANENSEAAETSAALGDGTLHEHSRGQFEHLASPTSATKQALLYAALSPSSPTANRIHRTCFPWLSAGNAVPVT